MVESSANVANLVVEQEILFRKDMEEQKISKIQGPITRAEKLDTQEIGAQNCMAKPRKLINLLMWPMPQKGKLSQDSKMYLCQMNS